MLADKRKQPVKPWFSGPYNCVYIYGTEAKNKYGRKKCYVHKLVHDHFAREKISKSKPFVHHIDGVETNNSITNLEAADLETNLKVRKFWLKDEKGIKRKVRSKPSKKEPP